MKEVTGEANMTIVAIVLIGILAAAAGVIISNLMQKVNNQADTNAGNENIKSDWVNKLEKNE